MIQNVRMKLVNGMVKIVDVLLDVHGPGSATSTVTQRVWVTKIAKMIVAIAIRRSRSLR